MMLQNVRQKVKLRQANRSPFARKATDAKKTRPKRARGFQDYITVEAGQHNDEQIEQPPAVQMGVAPKHPFRMVITGPSGSGKTTAACHLLEKLYEEYFDEIHLISPTAKWDPAWDRCKKQDGFKIHDELDVDFLAELYDTAERECRANGGKGDNDDAPSMRDCKKRLIVFDDFISNSRYMRSPEMLLLCVQGRHVGLSLMFLSQSYMKIERSCRLQASDIMFFPSNLSEVERVSEEHCPPNTSRQDFKKLILHATKKKHDFLFINKRNEADKCFRRNFDTILTMGSGTMYPVQHEEQEQPSYTTY